MVCDSKNGGVILKTLYVSDLDGTLLRGDQQTSEFTNYTINKLVDEGMIFSYATARSLVTAKKATSGIKAKIPLIVYNGAFVIDNETKKVLIANYFDDSVMNILDELFANQIYPIVYSYIDGVEKFSFVPRLCTEGMMKFLDSRKGDVRTNIVNDSENLKNGEIFYITCIDEEIKLKPFYDKYKDKYHCVFQKDIYTGDQWLEIMPITASKSNAIMQLKELLNCDRVISFGDGKNDIDMFNISDESYAVQNADDELKTYATAVISSNDEDGVAHWLAETVLLSSQSTHVRDKRTVPTTRTIRYMIDKRCSGKTIEQFLKNKGYTRQSIVDLKKMDRNLLIDDEWVFTNHKLKENDELVVRIQETEVSEKIVPVNLPFKIVYEDDDILVVDKPSNMPIHPSLNNYENTLANAVAYYFDKQGMGFVFRCINRLDKDTSGLTILAKHQVCAGIMYSQMAQHKIHREYMAIVEGEDIEDEGCINLPIGRVEGSGIERCVDLINGEKAVTHYKTICRFNGKALISLHLETGRTHQIRVHMTHIGHPLIGDWLYNPKNAEMSRQALHSHKLNFVHPITGEEMNLTSDIPEDMKKVIGQ